MLTIIQARPSKYPIVYYDPFKVKTRDINGTIKCFYCSALFPAAPHQIDWVIAHQKIYHRVPYLLSRTDGLTGWEETWYNYSIEEAHNLWQSCEWFLRDLLCGGTEISLQDIEMPVLEYEEFPDGKRQWMDLDRQGNVNWYFDQWEGAWIERPHGLP